MPTGSISYAVSAVAFGLLTLLLATSWRGRIPGAALTGACAVTFVWGVVLALRAAGTPGVIAAAEFLELLRMATWASFLAVLIVQPGSEARVSTGFRGMLIVMLGASGVLLALALARSLVGLGTARDLASFLIGIGGPGLLAVCGLVLVEMIYRNAAPERRWNIKFLCIALGGMFAYDFYLYSDALLFRRVSPEAWSARGFVSVLFVPFIAVAAARNPVWSLEISVSRGVVFHSTALLGAGLYLLVMAVAGYYIRYFGGDWGAMLQYTFLFGAGMLLLLILFSGTLRARLKVFLSKNFFSYRFDYREEWLGFTETLSSRDAGGDLRERVLKALAGLVESPGGSLWIRQEQQGYTQAVAWNVPRVHVMEPVGSELCGLMQSRSWVVPVDGAARDPNGAPLQLPHWLRETAGAWIVVPLILHDSLLGFVVLERPRAEMKLNWEVSDLLKTAGRQAAGYLGQIEAAQALAQARQFESFSRMSTFIVHDLKNLVAQLSLLLSNAQRHKDNPEFQADMLSTIENSVEKMNGLLLQLRTKVVADKPVILRLDDIVTRAVSSRKSVAPALTLEIADPELGVVASSERLERAIGNLVQNAVEATAPSGTVRVRQFIEQSMAVVEVRDTGKGMTEEFVRQGLFRPFETTKATGVGVGAYESREYVREIGGRIEVDSAVGAGTTFRVVLPLARRDDDQGSVELDRDAA
jgi:putative PEP-CTERM system histidine kinase